MKQKQLSPQRNEVLFDGLFRVVKFRSPHMCFQEDFAAELWLGLSSPIANLKVSFILSPAFELFFNTICSTELIIYFIYFSHNNFTFLFRFPILFLNTGLSCLRLLSYSLCDDVWRLCFSFRGQMENFFFSPKNKNQCSLSLCGEKGKKRKRTNNKMKWETLFLGTDVVLFLVRRWLNWIWKYYFLSPFLFFISNIPLYIDFVYSDVMKEIFHFPFEQSFISRRMFFGGKLW